MKQQRTFKVFRVQEDDRRAIQELSNQTDPPRTRHQALLDLVETVATLQLPTASTSKRRPIRIGIPTELDQAINRAKKKSGQSYAAILLAAVHAKRPPTQKPKCGRPRKQPHA